MLLLSACVLLCMYAYLRAARHPQAKRRLERFVISERSFHRSHEQHELALALENEHRQGGREEGGGHDEEEEEEEDSLPDCETAPPTTPGARVVWCSVSASSRLSLLCAR